MPGCRIAAAAANRSADQRSVGKGDVEGVAASEAGNNGVAGATLIPLLALGVADYVITAIIFGAFVIYGLQPGPMMFVLNANIVYSLFIGLIVSSIFLFLIGSIAIRGFKGAQSPKCVTLYAAHMPMPPLARFGKDIAPGAFFRPLRIVPRNNASYLRGS